MSESSHSRSATELIHLYDDCEAANGPPMLKNTPFAFHVEPSVQGEGIRIVVGAAGETQDRTYHIPGGEQGDYAAFYRELAHDWGIRVPHAFAEPGRRRRPTSSGGRSSPTT